jgi:hypothetical protein
VNFLVVFDGLWFTAQCHMTSLVTSLFLSFAVWRICDLNFHSCDRFLAAKVRIRELFNYFWFYIMQEIKRKL